MYRVCSWLSAPPYRWVTQISYGPLFVTTSWPVNYWHLNEHGRWVPDHEVSASVRKAQIRLATLQLEDAVRKHFAK